MSHWRWRLWIQANDEPPEQEKPKVHPSWMEKARLVYTRGMSPMRLMLLMRIGHRLAENILAQLEG